jgi:hypothetical protein
MDREAIDGGDYFFDQILRGLEQSPWYLLVLSPNSEKSECVKDEVHWAFIHRTGRIIPVMLNDCDPYRFHLRLPRLQYIDLRQHDDAGRNALARVLRDAIQSDGSEPQINISTTPRTKSDLDELVAISLALIPREEQKHLRNLLEGTASRYRGGRTVRHELRHLCDLGTIERQPGQSIGALRDHIEVDVSKIVRLTGVGKLLARSVS